MRTNIVIDGQLMDAAMRAAPFKTKRETVEAGLRLLARQAAYREILALRGQLRREDAPKVAGTVVSEPRRRHRAAPAAGSRRRAR